MKKILIIRMWADELNINNYNCQEIGLAKSLIRNGNHCDIVLYTKGETREEDYFFDDEHFIHIFYLRAKNILKNCFYEKKLYSIINDYDIVQSAECDQLANIKLFKILKDKLIIYHGPYYSKYTKGYNFKCKISSFFWFFNKNYKNVKCYSKSILAKEFLNNNGFKNVTTLGVGLDIDRFGDKNNSNNLLIENLIIEKKHNNLKYLLYIGKIEERRNILFLLSVIKKCVESNNNIKLILVGKGNDLYINKCLKYIYDNNIQDNIIYYESFNQKDLSGLYNNCDLFLLPTNYEIFGMVILESMYFGLPVVSTRNGGSSTLIKNNVNGFIRDLSVDDWTACIFEYLDNNASFKRSLSIAASETIYNNFLWSKIAKKYIKNL